MATPVASAPDRYSAVVAATSQGSRVEILSEHTDSQRVWANPDGSFTVDAYAGPEFVEQANGSWQDVNTQLVPSADGKSVEPVTAAADITLANGAVDPAGPVTATVATVVVPGDSASLTSGAASVATATAAAGAPAAESVSGPAVSVSVGWNGDLPKPTLSDNMATYANVAPGQDLRIAAKPRGVEAFVDLTTKPAVIPAAGLTVTLPLSTKGLTASSDGQGGYVLKDAAGQVVSDAPEAMVWDASVDPLSGDPVHRVSLPTTVTTTSTGYALSVTVPASFLNDPAVQWPVTVDPTETIYASADTYVEKGYNTSNYGTVDDLKVGTYDGGTHVGRSFIAFPFTTDAKHSIAGTNVTKAYLHLYEWWSSSCTKTAMSVKALSSGFSESSSTWNVQPTIASTVYGTITDAMGASATSCPDGKLGGNTGFSVLPLVAGWASGSIKNYGMALTASETDSLSWKRFYSSEHSYAGARPYLTVTYTNYPSTPGTPTVTPIASGWTNSSTPQLAVSVKDPDVLTDITPVWGRFQILNGGTQVCTVDGTHVTSPGTSVVTSAALGKACSLTAGVPYTVRAYAVDGLLLQSKAVSASTSFTIDQTAPGAPTITSSATNLTAGAWTDPMPASNTFTLKQPSGTTDVTSFQYSKDGGPWTSVTATSGSSTLAWVPGQGVHTLSVRSVDHANNLSASATTVSFNVGPGGITSPAANDRTQAYVSLTTDAPTTRTHIIKYEYQVGNSTTAAANTLGGWTTIPAADVFTPGTLTSPGYPLARTTTGAFPTVDWNLVKTVTAAGGSDGLVQIRACLGTSTADTSPLCSVPVPVTLDAAAFGGTYATSGLGPGNVSLTTGDWSTSDTDASFGGISISRSLTTLSPSAATAASGGVFGPGWTASLPTTAGASDLVLADHIAQGYATLTAADGSQSTYVSTGTTLPARFTGVGDAADGSVLKKVSTTSYTLTDTDGTVTTWTLSGSAWQVASVVQPGNERTATFTYDSSNRVTRVLAPVPTGVTCPATGALPAGCRALNITYAPTTTATGTTTATWGDYVGQISSISYTSYDPATSTMGTVTVASYSYDSTGHLRAEWDPRISPALKTTYDYNGNRLTTLTPAGQNAWTLHYDTKNRVVDASRVDPTNGTATTAVVYDIPITGTGAAIDFSPTGYDPATWGYATDLPRVGAAVFPASHVPGTPNANGDYVPASTDWPFADLSYQDVNGRTVASASYGAGQWLISSQEYDTTGNVVWSLDATSRAEAVNPTAASDAYVQGLTTSAARAAALASTSTYDAAGNLITSTGPVHDVVLAADPSVEVPVRQVTTNTYDGGAPAGGPYYLVTTTTTAPTPVDGTPVAAADTKITKTSYDPIDGASTTGLTSGWVLRSPTKTTTIMGAAVGGLSTATDIAHAVVYDASGRVVQNRQPSDSTGTTAGTRVTTYYTTAANTTFSACGGHPEWAGMVCRTGPAAQPAGATIPATMTTYNRYDEPLIVTDTSGSTIRTTTNSYDAAGRLTSTKTSDNLPADVAVLEQDIDYDPTTGTPIKTRSVNAGTTVATATTVYDAIGRVVRRDDGNGNTATTDYTIDGQLKRIVDAKGTMTYTYDGASGEHRGLVTSVDAGIGSGVPSLTTASYDLAGTPTITYPNGVVATRVVDTAGTLQSLNYVDSAGTNFAEWDQTFNAYGQLVTSSGPSAAGNRTVTYAYDPAGRLTTASDQMATQCTVRGYGLDGDSNRTSQYAWVGADQAACPTSAAVSVSSMARSSTYDTFDRATATTVTGTGAGSASYAYDELGRALSVPQVDISGSSPVVAGLTYFANDLVATESQIGGVTRTFGLDVLRRLNTWTDTLGILSTVVTNHYDGMGDSPAWTTSSDGTTTTVRRNIPGPDGNLALTTSVVGAGTASATLNIVNPHGDVFTTIPDVVNVTAAQVGACNDTDEFGVTLTPSAPSYGWVGGKLRSTNTATGLIQMGVRVYDPVTGRFLSTDSVYGGNENTYTYPVDPVNVSDTSGRCPCAVYGWTLRKVYEWTYPRPAGSSMTDYLIARGWISDPKVIAIIGFRISVSVTGMGGQVWVSMSNATSKSYFMSANSYHTFTLYPYYSLQRWGSQRSLAWSFTVEIEPMIVWEIQEGSGLNVGYQLRVVRLVRVWGVVGYR